MLIMSILRNLRLMYQVRFSFLPKPRSPMALAMVSMRSTDDITSGMRMLLAALSRLTSVVFLLISVPPIQYYQLCRLEKAKNLIQYSPFSVTQITDMLDFSCLSAFTRAFKNQYHIHPSFFRKSTAR